MVSKQLIKLALAGIPLVVIIFGAYAQQGKWAAASDQTAKSIIDMERQWVESGCTHSGIIQTILADDFQGTTNGSRYSKSEAIEQEKTSKLQSRECRLSDTEVHLFGDNLAIVYGTERAIRKTPEGKGASRNPYLDRYLAKAQRDLANRRRTGHARRLQVVALAGSGSVSGYRYRLRRSTQHHPMR